VFWNEICNGICLLSHGGYKDADEEARFALDVRDIVVELIQLS
jgi:hypothetical protein